MTPPKYFNDPWDFLVRAEPYKDAQLASEATNLGVPVEVLRTVSGETDFLAGESEEFQQEISRIIGVLCLTENPLNRLMWANYSNSHAGFVAGFQHLEAGKPLGFRIRRGPFGDAAKVVYAREHPLLKRDKSNLQDVVSPKYIEWEYEREWRVIESLEKATRIEIPNGTRFVLKFPPTALTRVVFGLRMPATAKNILKEMLMRPEFQHVRQEEVVVDSGSAELLTRGLSN